MAKLISVTVRAKKEGSSLAPVEFFSSEAQGLNSGQIVNFTPCICKNGEGIANGSIFDPLIQAKIRVKGAAGEKVTLWVTETVSAIVAKDA